MKFVSGGIQHETNTFSQTPTTLADFVRDSHCGERMEGGQVLEQRMRGTGTIHGGYLHAAAARNIQLAPLISVRAQPSGRVTDECFDRVLNEFLSRMDAEGSFDGVLLDLHGAMATDSHDDAEGAFLEAVRAAIGPETPIVATLDLHANISAKMASLANVIIGFDTYPHVDMHARGEEAVGVLAAIVSGKLQPVQVFRALPLLTMPPMQCTLRQPMQSLIEELHRQEQRPGVVTATIAMGFPFADIADAGVSVLVTTDNDQSLADEVAESLAHRIWGLRDDLQPELTRIETAIAWVREQEPQQPVLFADGSDNPGGGAPCDGTVALRALIEADLQGTAVAVIYDPETAEQAHRAGEGAEIQVRLGGKTDNRHGETVEAFAHVEQLSDGRFRYAGPMMQGVEDTLGPTARLRIGNVQVIVSSVRRQCLDTSMLRVAGVQPEACSLIVVKSAVHFRADFGPLSSRIFDGDTPGIHRPDFAGFDYQHLRRPIYPLDANEFQ